MPYSENQLRCLESMGLVPWIARNGDARNGDTRTEVERNGTEISLQPLATSPQQTTSVEAPSFETLPLIGIPFRGNTVMSLGNQDAALLVLVEPVSTTQKQFPFESPDAKLFDDMLRGISWRRQEICLGVVSRLDSQLPGTVDTNATVADLTKAPREAVLVFSHRLPESENPDDLRIFFQRKQMPVWQIPHPALLRESPARKRQAWNVLKAARACLQ